MALLKNIYSAHILRYFEPIKFYNRLTKYPLPPASYTDPERSRRGTCGLPHRRSHKGAAKGLQGLTEGVIRVLRRDCHTVLTDL